MFIGRTHRADMSTESRKALKSMLHAKNLLLITVLAGSLSMLAYVNHGILAYTFAIPVLFLVFEFVMRLFEVKQGLKRRVLWERQDVPTRFEMRIVQALLMTVFWAGLMYLMAWFDDVAALVVATAVFGIVMFFFGEWQARRRKPT